MKNVVLFLLGSTVILGNYSACSNNRVDLTTIPQKSELILFDKTPEVIQANINGKWQLAYQTGGITGGTYIPKEKVLYSFEPDSVSISYFGGQTVKNSFKWLKDSSSQSSSGYIYLMYYGFLPIAFVKIYNDTLVINDYQVADGFTHYLSRVK